MSVSTNNWDLVYALRVPALNQILSNNFYAALDKKQKAKLSLSQTIAHGTNGGIDIWLNPSTNLYEKSPLITLNNIDGSPVTNTEVKPIYSIQALSVISPSSYTTTPTIGISAADVNAFISVKMIIGTIKVVLGGKGYTTAPGVTISGGGGASAQAVLTNGVVTAIRITNAGQNYSAVPTITIDAPPVLPGTQAATATAELSIVLQVADGGQFSTFPVVTLNGQNGGVKVLAVIVDLQLQQKDTSKVADIFGEPPIISIQADSVESPKKSNTAFTVLKFKNVGLHYTPNDTPIIFLNKLFLKASIGLVDYLKITYALNVQNAQIVQDLQTAYTKIIYDNNTPVYDYIGKMMETTFRYFIDQTDLYTLNHELSILQKAQKQDKDAVTEASFILKNYPNADLGTAIATLKEEELRKAMLRVYRVFRLIEASIVFDFTKQAQDPTIVIPMVDYRKKIGDLPTPDKDSVRNLFCYNVMEIVAALMPEDYAHQIVGLGSIDTDRTFKFQQIRLNIGAWQITTGGSDKTLRLKIPIRSGLLYFGGIPTFIEPKHTYYLLIELQLLWLKESHHMDLSLHQDAAINVLALNQEDTTHQIPRLTQNPEDITSITYYSLLMNFIAQTLNQKIIPSKLPAQYHLLAPIDFAFSYKHTFASVNIFETLADEQQAFSWMYPTTAEYAIVDEAEIVPDINKSVLGICCMVEGRASLSNAKIDRASIPDGVDTSIIMSNKIVLKTMFLPFILMAFQKKDANSKFTVPLTMEDVETSDGRTYTLNLPSDTELETDFLSIKDNEGDKLGKIKSQNWAVSADNNSIIIDLQGVEYNILFTGASSETEVKISKKIGLGFGLVGNELQVSPKEMSYSFYPTYKNMESASVWALLGQFALEIAETVLLTLVFSGIYRGIVQFKNRGVKGSVDMELSSIIKNTEEFRKIWEEANDKKNIYTTVTPIFSDAMGQAIETFDFTDVSDNKYTFKLEGAIGIGGGAFDITYDPKQPENARVQVNKYPSYIDGDYKEKFVVWANEFIDIRLQKINSGSTSVIKKNIPNFKINAPEDSNVSFSKRFKTVWQSMKSDGLELVTPAALAAMVAGIITGCWVIITNNNGQKAYEDYKQHLTNGLSNLERNGLSYLTNNLISKVKWPKLSDQHHYTLTNFYLDGDLVIGLNLDEQQISGYTSQYNPHVPIVHLPSTTKSITISNTGDNPLTAYFVVNQNPYEGSLGKQVGNIISVLAHSSTTLLLSDFSIQNFAGKILHIESSANGTSYTLNVNPT
jgi:Clostridium P-47 protein